MEQENRGQNLKRIIETYGNDILRLCFLYLGDYQLAEDAAQETFLKVYINYEKFEKRSSEKTWITRIAVNCCKNLMRTRWFSRVFPKENLEGSGQNELEKLILKNTLSYEIMKLPRKYREVILLYYYQELKLDEISAVLHIQEANAAQRLSRARKMLKSGLEEEK